MATNMATKAEAGSSRRDSGARSPATLGWAARLLLVDVVNGSEKEIRSALFKNESNRVFVIVAECLVEYFLVLHLTLRFLSKKALNGFWCEYFRKPLFQNVGTFDLSSKLIGVDGELRNFGECFRALLFERSLEHGPSFLDACGRFTCEYRRSG